MCQGTIFLRLAHIDDQYRVRSFFQGLRRNFPDATERIGQRRPGRVDTLRLVTLRPAAAEIRGDGDVDLPGMRQAEVFHVANEVFLADFAAQTRIETPFLSHARDRKPAVVVPRI
jgi:hypothetical protein